MEIGEIVRRAEAGDRAADEVIAAANAYMTFLETGRDIPPDHMKRLHDRYGSSPYWEELVKMMNLAATLYLCGISPVGFLGPHSTFEAWENKVMTCRPSFEDIMRRAGYLV